MVFILNLEMKPFTRILSGVTRYFSQGFDELIPSQPSKSRSLDFNFPYKRGTGLAKMIPFGTPECRELLLQLLIYDPDDRMSARQAIRHPFFREMRYVRHSFLRLSRLYSNRTSPTSVYNMKEMSKP